jgi:trans-2,3-dihydro-3-hydroxyanthranilate isomerase
MLELKVGPIPIEIFSVNGKVQRVVMSQKKPQFLKTYDPAEVMPAFGLSANDVLKGYPIQTISTGTSQLFIPVRDLEVLRRIQVNAPLFNALRAKGDWFSPHLFCAQGVTLEGQTFARHVGTTMEDPFTGSATGGMAAYLYHYGIIQQAQFIAEQGHWMHRPGKATVEVVGSRDDIETVKVGGSAITVLKGELLL